MPRRGRIGLYHYAILLPDRASLGRFLSHLSAIGEHPAGVVEQHVDSAEALAGLPRSPAVGLAATATGCDTWIAQIRPQALRADLARLGDELGLAE